MEGRDKGGEDGARGGAPMGSGASALARKARNRRHKPRRKETFVFLFLHWVRVPLVLVRERSLAPLLLRSRLAAAPWPRGTAVPCASRVSHPLSPLLPCTAPPCQRASLPRRPSRSPLQMAQEQVDPAKLAQMIEYSEKYQDDTYEYRCVVPRPSPERAAASARARPRPQPLTPLPSPHPPALPLLAPLQPRHPAQGAGQVPAAQAPACRGRVARAGRAAVARLGQLRHPPPRAPHPALSPRAGH